MKSIRLPLYCGSLYFFLVSIAHAIGFKVPGLFIYFNVQSYSYQDKIISLLAFGWSAFLFTAARNPSKPLIRAIVLSGGVALLMLLYINFSTDFVSLSKNINPQWFNLEVILLFVYWAWLLLGYLKVR